MNAHSRLVGKNCAKHAKSKHGAGWAYLSEEQQRGAIALEVVSVLTAQPENATPDVVQHCKDVARAALYEE